MEKINLTKYGFIRSPEDDFSDDGTRFTCYKVGRVRISKASWRDQVFIAGTIGDGNKLDYTEYSALPHYKDLDKLNGVNKIDVTDQDLIDLYNACIAYDKEYTEAENKIIYPTIEALKNRCYEIKRIRNNELADIILLLEKAAMKLILEATETDIKYIRDNIANIRRNALGFDPDEYPQTIQHSIYGRKFVTDNCYDLRPSYSYTNAKERIAKYL